MADVAPTLLDALNIAMPPGMEGRSLLAWLRAPLTTPQQPSFARLRIRERHQYMAQTMSVKYIHDLVTGESTWYDYTQDPYEYTPLRTPPPGGAELQAHADALATKPIPEKGANSPPLTNEEKEHLKAQGYL